MKASIKVRTILLISTAFFIAANVGLAVGIFAITGRPNVVPKLYAAVFESVYQGAHCGFSVPVPYDWTQCSQR